jgi:Lactate racemase N-terminal domain
VIVFGDTLQRYRPGAMGARVPLLYGSRLVVATAPDDAVVLAPPPPPGEPIADVGAAVRDALRFPLAGEPLETLVPRGARVTILTEPAALPIPGTSRDPRQAALAAVSDELERIGVPTERQTILVAAGLARRPGRRALESLVTPQLALRFRGEVVVHDVEDPALVEVGGHRGAPLHVHPALVEADAVVTVTAAETVLHGGAAVLVAAASPEVLRASTAASLLETSLAPGWELALALERAVAARVPLIGVSLTLDLPRLTGTLRGYPYEQEAVDRVARSRLARAFGLLPAPLRMRTLASFPLEITASAAFAGPPSVAHAEALVRSVETESAVLEERLDAICVGIPRTTPSLPRERPNALISAALGIGYTFRLWRDAFPVRDGGTAILVAPFRRRFAHPTQQPYRAFFQATRGGREPALLAGAERAAAADPRAIDAYREGRTCHPRQPFADWESCLPALDRLGAVLVAGCRDSAAARQLGFVPTHGVAAALEMARGLAGDGFRIGFLLSPPYFPLRVGGG